MNNQLVRAILKCEAQGSLGNHKVRQCAQKGIEYIEIHTIPQLAREYSYAKDRKILNVQSKEENIFLIEENKSNYKEINKGYFFYLTTKADKTLCIDEKLLRKKEIVMPLLHKGIYYLSERYL